MSSAYDRSGKGGRAQAILVVGTKGDVAHAVVKSAFDSAIVNLRSLVFGNELMREVILFVAPNDAIFHRGVMQGDNGMLGLEHRSTHVDIQRS